jgi:hypothetical protein
MSEPMNREMMQDQISVLTNENYFLRKKLFEANAALELIAAPKRSDGTYNRCREACEQLAKETLKKTSL